MPVRGLPSGLALGDFDRFAGIDNGALDVGQDAGGEGELIEHLAPGLDALSTRIAKIAE